MKASEQMSTIADTLTEEWGNLAEQSWKTTNSLLAMVRALRATAMELKEKEQTEERKVTPQ